MRGRTLAGRYRLEAPLGRGGMGEVWRASDLRLNRTVAIKILSLNGVPDQTVARFRREAEIAGGLQHPGIAVVFDSGTDGDVLYLVMELLDGSDLAKVVQRHPGGLPIGRTVTLLAQIADALAEAHANGVIHRDIKPANAMLLKGDRTKVLDFGIARYTEQTTDLTGSALIGTPAFMAPEQFDRNEGVDHRTDLYALGALGYELLTGRRPFTAGTVRRLLHDVLFTPAPAVRDTRPDVPRALDELIAELLAKDPGDRPDDARSVAERLRAVGGEPVARPVSVGQASGTPQAEAATTALVPVPATLLVSVPARRRRPRRLRWRGAVPLAVLAVPFAAFCLSPGSPLRETDNFRAEPACDRLRPTVFTGVATENDGSIDCHWYKEEGRRGVVDDGSYTEYDYKIIWDLRVTMSLHSPTPLEWLSGADEAAIHMEKQKDKKSGNEPSLGPGAYSSLGDNPYRGTADMHFEADSHTFSFRVNNLVATIAYLEDRSDIEELDQAEVRTKARKLAEGVAAEIRRSA